MSPAKGQMTIIAAMGMNRKARRRLGKENGRKIIGSTKPITRISESK